jgi:hypothetical protein
MKNNLNFWKLLSVVATFSCISMFALTAFKTKTESAGTAYEKQLVPGEGNSPIISDRAEAKQLYGNFSREYSTEVFPQRGGTISKSTLATLYNAMKNPNDTLVYYYFGRSNDEKNLLMFFNDPAYNDLSKTDKFKTVAPYCPPECNAQLNAYLTGE